MMFYTATYNATYRYDFFHNDSGGYCTVYRFKKQQKYLFLYNWMMQRKNWISGYPNQSAKSKIRLVSSPFSFHDFPNVGPLSEGMSRNALRDAEGTGCSVSVSERGNSERDTPIESHS